MTVVHPKVDRSPDIRLKRLLEIMVILRSEDGCPWDAKQTPESLKPYIVEEAYEVLEAIDHGNPEAIRDELGDLLLQIVFQSRIFEERGDFSMADVIDAISAKLTRRHPHVFADAPIGDTLALETQWETIKTRENLQRGKSTLPLSNLPRHLPALQSAQKIVKKTRAEAGTLIPAKILDQVTKQLHGLSDNIHRNRTQNLSSQLGNLFFTLVRLGEAFDIDAEDALRKRNNYVIDHYHANQAKILHTD